MRGACACAGEGCGWLAGCLAHRHTFLWLSGCRPTLAAAPHSHTLTLRRFPGEAADFYVVQEHTGSALPVCFQAGAVAVNDPRRALTAAGATIRDCFRVQAPVRDQGCLALLDTNQGIYVASASDLPPGTAPDTHLSCVACAGCSSG